MSYEDYILKPEMNIPRENNLNFCRDAHKPANHFAAKTSGAPRTEVDTNNNVPSERQKAASEDSEK